MSGMTIGVGVNFFAAFFLLAVHGWTVSKKSTLVDLKCDITAPLSVLMP